MSELGNVKHLGKILCCLSMEVWHKYHQLREIGPQQVSSRCHHPEAAQGTPTVISVQTVGHVDVAMTRSYSTVCVYVSIL